MAAGVPSSAPVFASLTYQSLHHADVQHAHARAHATQAAHAHATGRLASGFVDLLAKGARDAAAEDLPAGVATGLSIAGLPMLPELPSYVAAAPTEGDLL